MRLFLEYTAVTTMTSVIICLYAILMKTVYPRYITRLHYSSMRHLGRGLKKYTYPDGRGVLYEPHPSIRKYVRSYILFTSNGYKYFKCAFDPCVKDICYSVVMMNNRDKVIDVLDITEVIRSGKESDAILLHQDTSYIAMVLSSVGNRAFDNKLKFYYRFSSIVIYALLVALTNFGFISYIAYALNFFTSGAVVFNPLGASLVLVLACSVLVGVIGALIIVAIGRNNGVRVKFDE